MLRTSRGFSLLRTYIFILFFVTSIIVESKPDFVVSSFIIVIFLFLKFLKTSFISLQLFLPDMFALVQKIGKLHLFIIFFGTL